MLEFDVRLESLSHFTSLQHISLLLEQGRHGGLKLLTCIITREY